MGYCNMHYRRWHNNGDPNLVFSGQFQPTHELTNTPIYHTWSSMRQRCKNPDNHAYKHYGGRGIGVCARYDESVVNLFEDMGQPPDELTLDRIDNDGGYWCGKCEDCSSKNQPQNLRWVSRTVQAMNQRLIKSDGKLRGVTKRPTGKYRARIMINRKAVSLGEYDTIKEAYKAFLTAHNTKLKELS